jgi:tRNA dimethylallyltransferase
MLAGGFIDEVRALKARGDLSPELPSMRAVGYRQAWEYLEGGLERTEMRDRALAATRQLAKRQLTWLRGFSDVTAVPWEDPQALARRLLGGADLAKP